MLALMHRVIDDFDAEWAPESFQGNRWHPSTRPRYITAFPSKATLKKRGVKIPTRHL